MIDDVFLSILGKLAAFFPRFELNDARIEAFYDVLGDLDRDLLKSAVMQIGSELEGPWGPSPGDLRNKCFDLLGSDTPSPGQAWDEIQNKMQSVGHMEIPTFSHPKIGEALRHIGGWVQICMADTRERISDRARFFECYRTVIVREQRQERMLPQVREAVLKLTASTAKKLVAKGE